MAEAERKLKSLNEEKEQEEEMKGRISTYPPS